MIAFIIIFTIALILSVASDDYLRGMDTSRNVSLLYGLLCGAGWALVGYSTVFSF